MTEPEAVLEQLVAGAAWRPDWPEALARAGESKAPQRRLRRRLILALVVAVAILAPFAARAAANDWWFFKTPGSPTPTSEPVVVKIGEWDGQPWRLVAYPSTTDGLCVSMIPDDGDNNSYGAAMGCGTFAGVARTTATKAGPDMSITFLSGSATKVLPAYIVGPVIEQATMVEVRFANGETLRTPTFAAPHPLDHVRFYATPLPKDQLPTTRGSWSPPRVAPLQWLAGLDENEHVVACLAPSSASNGVSPLSACR
jgi:hypothetical protein